jgi:hypothetical protein
MNQLVALSMTGSASLNSYITRGESLIQVSVEADRKVFTNEQMRAVATSSLWIIQGSNKTLHLQH